MFYVCVCVCVCVCIVVVAVKVYVCCMLSHSSRVQLCATPWIVAHWASLSMGFSRQEYWSRLPGCPSPIKVYTFVKTHWTSHFRKV